MSGFAFFFTQFTTLITGMLGAALIMGYHGDLNGDLLGIDESIKNKPTKLIMETMAHLVWWFTVPIKTCDFHIYVSIPKSMEPNHHGILNTPDMVPHMWFYPLLFTKVSGIFNDKIYGIYNCYNRGVCLKMFFSSQICAWIKAL